MNSTSVSISSAENEAPSRFVPPRNTSMSEVGTTVYAMDGYGSKSRENVPTWITRSESSRPCTDSTAVPS